MGMVNGGWLSGWMASLFQWFSWFRSDYANLLGTHRFVSLSMLLSLPALLCAPSPFSFSPLPIRWLLLIRGWPSLGINNKRNLLIGLIA